MFRKHLSIDYHHHLHSIPRPFAESLDIVKVPPVRHGFADATMRKGREKWAPNKPKLWLWCCAVMPGYADGKCHSACGNYSVFWNGFDIPRISCLLTSFKNNGRVGLKIFFFFPTSSDSSNNSSVNPYGVFGLCFLPGEDHVCSPPLLQRSFPPLITYYSTSSGNRV
ncbi:hypothetical protein BO70DRAFT_168836 [Aspergillus heteromorphus CBS 117.55]|uniref:Uncharacterized protein n=1 Tax=Aspergillus heteromorphus CBS 117.55 TaxID=1448321 RepID=A0A317V3C2_9EURO|nr:uncharacterized protein BO70DRAFT_168836 [Aspergillus heteromorphus CBS 117.55]PWY67558.1 hypothetical protein BO70DRAFT_168836 [Aspergillus heteromorphus CBS 117.55]